MTTYFERRRKKAQSEKKARIDAARLASLAQEKELRALKELRVFEFTRLIFEARDKFHLKKIANQFCLTESQQEDFYRKATVKHDQSLKIKAPIEVALVSPIRVEYSKP